MRQLTNIGMFYGELGKESGLKKRVLPTIKNDSERDRKDRIMPILPALHNAALRCEHAWLYLSEAKLPSVANHS